MTIEELINQWLELEVQAMMLHRFRQAINKRHMRGHPATLITMITHRLDDVRKQQERIVRTMITQWNFTSLDDWQ